MERQQAYEMLQKYLTNPVLIKHSLATEATMRMLATYFGENEDTWGIVGLLHDADYELAKGHPEKHGMLLFEKEQAVPENIAHAIKAHNYQHTSIMPVGRMDWGIACCDELTAIITAATLATPNKKIAQISVEFIMNRLRDKNFAKGGNRTHIYLCQEKLGIPLIEFVTLTLRSMQGISDQLEL